MKTLGALVAILLSFAGAAQAAPETALFRCLEGLHGLLVPEDMNFRRLETAAGPQYLVQAPPRYILFDGQGHRFADTTKLDPAFRREVQGPDGVVIPEIRLAIPRRRGDGPARDKDYQPLIVREGTLVENGVIMSWLSGDYGVDGKKWSLRLPKSDPLIKSTWMGKAAVAFRNEHYLTLEGVDAEVFNNGVRKPFFRGLVDRVYRLAVESLEYPAPEARAASQRMQTAKRDCGPYFEQEIRENRLKDRELEDLHFAMDKVISSPNSGVKPPEPRKDEEKGGDGVQ